jgi:ribose transport system ATP-binding protein
VADNEHVPLWQVKGIAKSFPGVRALEDVDLVLREGEIHALVGQNGSGKSTLARCIAGVHQPDAGQLLHRGEEVIIKTPSAARALGVAAFHQEYSLVPSLSVAENISLGQPQMRGPLVDWGAMKRRAKESLARLSIVLNPDRPVSSLSVAEQQLVEIAKAISSDMKLLMLDEPTAALGPEETERLHEVIRLLASQDVAILYISHRLADVLSVADLVTVLRDGRRVGTVKPRDATVRDVIRLMIGAELAEKAAHRVDPSQEMRVSVRDLHTDNGVRAVSFDIRRGEILGLGGVVGAGRTEIARGLFGVDKVTAGSVQIDGRDVELQSPQHAIRAGIALVPEDRKADGLFFNFAAPPNISIAALDAVRRGPFLSPQMERRKARELIDDLQVDRHSEERSVGTLSGGNQQKIVLGRWLFSKAKLLILDEATQGVDVGAKFEIYRVLNDITGRGISVLFISSDYPELLELCDRVAVVRGGRIVHVAKHGELTEHELLEMAAGDRTEAAI